MDYVAQQPVDPNASMDIQPCDHDQYASSASSIPSYEANANFVPSADRNNLTPDNLSKISDYIKSRFNSDNWFGSLVTPFMGYVYYQNMKAAQTRKINGISTPDHKRELSAQLYMAEKTWSFFSARGGKFPEGKTAWQRILNALKHPQLSSAQFEWLILSPVVLLNNTTHFINGLKAYGIGLKPGETAYAPEKIRLYQALYQFAAASLSGVGHFRNHATDGVVTITPAHEPSPSSTRESQRSIPAVLKKMWNHDRILLVGSLMTMFSPILPGIEAWAKSRKSRTEAIHLAKGAFVNSIISACYGFYIFQRIAKSNYTKADASVNTVNYQEINTQQPSPEEINKKKFTEKLEAESQMASSRNV